MPVLRLQASVRRLGEIPVVDLRGDIDAPGEAALDAAYQDARSGAARAIMLNFCDAGFINSKGIALIVELLSQARRAGQRLIAYGLNNHYRRIFEITRLSNYLDLYQDESSALAAAATLNAMPPGSQE